MTNNQEQLEQEKQALRQAHAEGPLATLKTYLKLSGPGWLQSGVTLGGGSLSTGLYLGVLAGFGMLWLQPLAMALGIIMLSGIAYVTLSTGERPFQAVNRHVNPVLGWGWALASLAANMVWCLPQFALANGVLQQNLFPELLGGEGGKWFNCIVILVLTVAVTWFYGSGHWGVKLYEYVLKGVITLIVLSFFGVVVTLALSGDDGLQWGAILSGFVPDFSRLSVPAEGFQPMLAQLSGDAREFWRSEIVGSQRDVMIGAAATAVGINMTFLLPYSMLSRGWRKDHRGLAIFDLSTGMLIPFLLATSCVVIASATQFHLKPTPGFLGETNAQGELVQPDPKLKNAYQGMVDRRIEQKVGGDAFDDLSTQELANRRTELPETEKKLAAMLVPRDVKDLSLALQPLTGKTVANYVFGIGVFGMALSTITLLMLISGFVICEMLNLPATGWPFRLATLAAATGVLGPFLWGKAAAYLAVPTSVFGMVLLPFAYISFLLLMNQKAVLGENMPRGRARVAWNVLLIIAATVASAASLFVIHNKAGANGWMAVIGLLVLALVVHFLRKPSAQQQS